MISCQNSKIYLSQYKNDFLTVAGISQNVCQNNSPSAIISSKLTIETLEQGVKYFQSWQ